MTEGADIAYEYSCVYEYSADEYTSYEYTSSSSLYSVVAFANPPHLVAVVIGTYSQCYVLPHTPSKHTNL